MAKWTHLPVEHAEAMQVLRYELGQKYGGHHDELDPTNDPRTVGGGPPRVATVLMYLSGEAAVIMWLLCLFLCCITCCLPTISAAPVVLHLPTSPLMVVLASP